MKSLLLLGMTMASVMVSIMEKVSERAEPSSFIYQNQTLNDTFWLLGLEHLR